MKKRFLAVFLALALCVGLMPTAFAAWEEFDIKDGVLLHYRGPGGDVVIPDGVTSIGDYAFRRCDSLTGVTIPNSVTDIGDYAFCYCDNLTSVTIPNSVTSIGDGAFYYCGSLTSVTIPDSVASIGDHTFRNCFGLTGVTIPTGVTSIGAWAFGCTSLTSVAIPNSVTEIGYCAFADCVNLKSVTIPSSITQIGEDAFVHYIYVGQGEAPIDFYIPSDLTLYGETGSYAETYAKENGIPFTALIHGFTDLKPNGFYVDAVGWAVANGITTGKTATTFAPDLKCSHSEILTFLWRAAGSPESSAQPPIAMKGSEFYYKAVKWAAEKGMIDKNFKPSAACTRAYAVQYIWQAFGKPDPAKASPFTDIPAHWSSAKAAAWAAEKGITTGTTATTFNPNGICNRGQIVTFLYRAYK